MVFCPRQRELVMAEHAERRMSIEEFLDWHDGTDTRHMLVDGVVVAMAPPTGPHSRIAGNVAYEVRRRLRPPCGIMVEAGIRLSAETCVQADVAVTCELLQPKRLMEQPVLLIEVLSPSTRRDDLGLKIVGYEEISSVREIWAVDSEEQAVRIWRRTGDGWIISLPIRAGSFRSDVLGDEIALDELYEGSGL
jgi:Uma2 family endonuclease